MRTHNIKPHIGIIFQQPSSRHLYSICIVITVCPRWTCVALKVAVCPLRPFTWPSNGSSPARVRQSKVRFQSDASVPQHRHPHPTMVQSPPRPLFPMRRPSFRSVAKWPLCRSWVFRLSTWVCPNEIGKSRTWIIPFSFNVTNQM